ncbi:helix-turn-helix domain-containing protein [Dactylosporangium sp. NPDC048998]|uniref:nSTAND1 domain-containing NTPase n=1 Tax=Dactylosporangium sp. NPDC048998 TaxID=3363976 RepID=UPI0037116F5E
MPYRQWHSGVDTDGRGGTIPGHGGTDPELIKTRDEFGAALTELRERASLTIDALARRAGLSPATAHDYVTGKHLPGPAQAAKFRGLLEACGVTGPAALDAWLAALSRVRADSDGRHGRRVPDIVPYLGLRPFDGTDAALFFGREKFLGVVLDRLTALRDSGGTARVLFLVGASGSGKSSLLRAGVQPAVHSGALNDGGETWSVVTMLPGKDPVEALRGAVDGVAVPRVLIIDQFEELYILAGVERAAAFVTALAALGTGTLVLAGLRADYFTHAAADPALIESLQHWQLVVPPLTEEELRSAVVRPAAAVGVTVDDALVEVVLAEIRTGARGHPNTLQNALPLLSHALLAAWERRQRRRLTLDGYRAGGGLNGAVQQSAEQAFADLDPDEQTLARRIFLRLITVDDDHLATKRRVARADLPSGGQATDPVLERFVARRLITLDGQDVEISHDALLTAWPRLTEWVAADHDGLRLHRRLTAAAESWRAGGDDRHLLLRGNLLAAVEDWAADPDHTASMNAVERDFLRHSTDNWNTEQVATRRRIRVLRQLVAALAVLVVLTGSSAGYAWRARNVAATQRTAADQARYEALSRQVAIESARARSGDPALAEQLALAAYRISPTVDARSALLDATANGIVHRLAGASGPTMLRINPAGTVVAVSDAGDGSVDLRAYAAGRPGAPLGAIPAADPGKMVYALAFSPDGTTLAIGGEGGHVRLIDVRDPAHPVPLADAPGSFGTAVESLAFAPDGHRLVAGGGGTPPIGAWAATGDGWHTPAAVPVTGSDQVVQAVAYSPDGRTLVAGDAAGALRFWAADRLDGPPATTQISPTQINAVAWSPDGGTVLAGARDGSATLVDAATHTVRAKLDTEFTSWVNAAAYAPGGDLITVGGSNNRLVVFDAHSMVRLATIASAAQITSIAYSPDSTTVHAAAADGSVHSFPAVPRTLASAAGPLYSIAVGQNGRTLAVASTGPAGRVMLWPLDGPPPVRMTVPPLPAWFGVAAGSVAFAPSGPAFAAGNRDGAVLLDVGGHPTLLAGAAKLIESVQFSPDGRLVAASSDDGQVHLWDVTDPAAPETLPALDSGGQATSVAFSPDGRSLAAASVDHTVHRWDLRDPHTPRVLPPLTGFGNYAWSVAFSADSRTVAAGGADDTIRLWDVSDPAQPRPIGAPLTGPTHYVYGLAFSPDGHVLAAAGGDGAVWTWRLMPSEPPQLTTALQAANPDGKTYAIAFTPDGRSLIAAGSAGTITFWPTDEQQVAADLCATAGDPLTAQEWAQYVPGIPYRRTCPR